MCAAYIRSVNVVYLVKVLEEQFLVDGVSVLDHGPAGLLQRAQDTIPLLCGQLGTLSLGSLQGWGGNITLLFAYVLRMVHSA